MKRIFGFVLAMALLLVGCGGTEDPATVHTAPTLPTAAPTEPTQPTEAPTEPTQPQLNYQHPLTGVAIAEPWAGRVVAVVMNNGAAAQPQYGISQADIIYEMQVDGGTTRNLAIFSDVSKVGEIGSVHAARTYFVSLAAAYDAYTTIWDSSVHAVGGKYDQAGHALTDWKHLDQKENTDLFYRQNHYGAGYAWENSLFTTGELVEKGLKDTAMSQLNAGLSFQTGVNLPGETKANQLIVTFNNAKTTSFNYDVATGLYSRVQYGKISTDGANNATVQVKNVLVLQTNQWSDGASIFYDTIGVGSGYAAINGKVTAINWSRAAVDQPFVYTLPDGTPLQLDVGSTYISIIGGDFPVYYY